MDDALKRKLEEHIAAGADKALLKLQFLALLQGDDAAPAHPAADAAENSVSARSETVPSDSQGGAGG